MSPSLYREEKLGEIIIQPGAPRTPQIIQGVMDTQLSSPIDRYTIIVSQSSPIAYLKHKASDREAKVTVSSLEDRLSTVEEQMREVKKVREEQDRLKEVREEQDRLIMEWETCDRLAQSLNDSIKQTIMNEVNLSKARIIWDAGYHNRYLPFLFTQWWLTSNYDDPVTYPLPKVFDHLSESDICDFVTRRPLADEICEAADLLWKSSLQPAIELMLMFYHKRLEGRNFLQHPTPSAAFAHSFLTSDASYSEEQKHQIKLIINEGRRQDGTFLFTQSTPQAASSSVPASHPTGTTRGITRQREVDDDGGMALKKQKQGE